MCIIIYTGYIIGFVMLMASYSFFMALLAFFYTASKATKFKSEMKKKIETDYKEGTESILVLIKPIWSPLSKF